MTEAKQVNLTLQLERDHNFQNQLRRKFVLPRGTQLAGELRIVPSTWPFGVIEPEHEFPSRLSVEFTFTYDTKAWRYRGFVDARHLWPTRGSRVDNSPPTDQFSIGPLGGLRDDRVDWAYTLRDGSERRFALKHIGFYCWLSVDGPLLHVKLRHYLPGENYVTVFYSLATEAILFKNEEMLSYDREGFLEDVCGQGPFVRVEECKI